MSQMGLDVVAVPFGCSAVPGWAVLCCAGLCCAVLCRAVLQHDRVQSASHHGVAGRATMNMLTVKQRSWVGVKDGPAS